MTRPDHVDEAEGAGRPRRGWPVLDLPLGVAAAFLLTLMTVLTTVDVLSRYFFNAPIDGAFEVTQLLLAALIFVALPLTTAAGEHVDVELLSGIAGPRVETLLQVLGCLISTLVLGVLAWRLWEQALRLAEDGAVTNSLGLPFAPIGYFAAVSCAVSAAIAAYRIRHVLEDAADGRGLARGDGRHD